MPPGIDCLQKSSIKVSDFESYSGNCLVQHIPLVDRIILLVEHSRQITIEWAVQIPVILLIGMPSQATK
jgi:hypothetical protein